MPPSTDRVAYGRYLSSSLGCFTCHSADFKTMNELEPEKSGGLSSGGGNAMLDQSGRDGGDAEHHLRRSDRDRHAGRRTTSTAPLRTGVRPDRRVLLYPMVPMPELTSRGHGGALRVPRDRAEAGPRRRAAGAAACSPPTRARARSSTTSTGARPATASTESASAICARPSPTIRPTRSSWPGSGILPSFKPGTKMPTWDGVIAENDYPALVAYVKELGAAAAANPATPATP